MTTTAESIDSLSEPLLRSPDEREGTSAAKRRRTKNASNQKFVMCCVITAVILERLAYYSLLGNLAVYATTVLRWNAAATLSVTLLFTGLTWLSCFLGGYFGDAVFGRMNTIIIGLIVYFIGFLCLPFLSWIVNSKDATVDEKHKPLNVVWFVVALLLISLGEGCFKSNMSPFGADQQPEDDGNKIENFFSYYYWAINLGSLLGFGPVIYLQDREGFIPGYAVPAGLLLLALIVFMLPRRNGYSANKPAPNITLKVYRIIKEAWAKKKRKRGNEDISSPTEYTGSGCYEDYVPMKHWLDRAMAKYGGSYLEIEVEEVKILLNILPVFGFLVVYCILYYQTNSTFVIQGMHMNINLHKWPVPVAWLAVTNTIFVLVFVPIIRKGLFPCLERFKIPLPNIGKILVGMFIASLSLISAGIVEVYREDTIKKVNNTISSIFVVGRDISIFYQIPQYGLMGISEIFVMITGLEFAYCQAPKRMQALVTGLFFIANGLGSMLGSMIFELISLAATNKFVHVDPADIKNPSRIGQLKGNLYYFFFGLAAFNLLNTLLFALYSWKRRVRNDNQSQQTVHEYIRSAMRNTPKKS